MEPFLDWVDADWLFSSETARNLIISILVIVFLMMGRWLIMRAVKSQTDDVRFLYKWSKGSTYVAVAIGLPLTISPTRKLCLRSSSLGGIGSLNT